MSKKFVAVCILMIAGWHTALCQNPDFRKLKKEIEEAKSQKEKAEKLLDAAMKLPPPMADSSFAIAQSVYEMAAKEDSLYVRGVAAFIEGFTHFRQQQLAEARRHMLKAQRILKNENEALYHSTFNFMGLIYFRERKYDSALMKFDELKQLPDTARLKLSAYGNSGRVHRSLGNYAQAIDDFEMTVKLDSSDEFSRLNSYLNIASIFEEMEMFDRGIETLEQVDIESFRLQPVVVAYYNNLGSMQYKNGDKETALKNLKKGLGLALRLRQYQLTVRNRITIAEIFASYEEFDSTLNYLYAARKGISQGRLPGSAVAHLDHTLATVYHQMEMYDSAIYYAKRVADAPRPWLTTQNKSLKILAESYDAIDKTEESKEYYKMHADFLDSLQSSYRVRFEEDAKAKYLLSQKEKEISEAQLRYENLETWQKVLLITVIVFLLGGLVLYLYLQKSKSQLSQAFEENAELNEQIAKNKSEILELKSKAIIPVDEIISIKSDGHYLEFYLSTKRNPEVDRNRIKEVLDVLPSKFVQIHRSYVVNVDHIKVKYSDKVILKDGNELPVSRTYKKQLANVLENR